MPSAAAWSGVCYGNGLFVAVVAGTAVSATSPDGITWTARTMPSSATWQSVCYGNGLFVAVADGPSTASASSPDGITWTARTLSSSGKWQSVCYGNGLFVTLDVGPGTVASTSPDGVNWTARTLPASTSWNKVCYGNGIFVATGSTTNAATSPDGITWTARTMPSSATWYALTFGNGVFTALNGAVGASCGGALTFAGDFTASRTHIVQDATGTVPLLEVAQSWTLTQRFNAAEAVTCGMAAVAGNGLVQLASGTTKANGVAFGTDTFIFRLSAGYLSLQTSGVGATDRHGVSFVRGGYSAPGAHLSDSNGDKVVLYNGDNQHSVIGVGTSGDTWFKGTNGGTGGQFDFYLGTSTALKVFTIDSFGNLLGDATNGGDLKIQRAGKGLYVKEGTNATMGTGTLVAGAVVISTTKITATSRVFLTSQVDGGTVGFLRVSARTAATSFTITSSSGTDTSTVAWIIMEPA